MLKKMLTLLMTVLVVFSMSACSGCEDKKDNEENVTSGNENVEDSSSVQETDVQEESIEETESKDNGSVELTGWEDLQFEFCNTLYTLPFEAGILNDNGWILSGLEKEYDSDYVLESGEKVSNVYAISKEGYNADVRTLVGFINNQESAAKVTECDVWSFVCNIYNETDGTLYENVPELKLANGITWGSTSDEIVAAYGEALSVIEGEADDYTVYMYMYNGLNIMKLTARDDLGLVEVVLLSYNE